MDKISELKEILGGFLKCNKARLDCFTRMLLALFAVRTVNLREIAVGFSSDAQIDSRYKRVKRFLAQFKVNQAVLAQWILSLFFSEEKKFYLTIDRTNWFWGKSKINILFVCIAYEGLAIPLRWILLNKAGNGTAKEHRHILLNALSTVKKERILGVLGDREFASGFLFKWLNRQPIPFYIRIKENSIVKIKKKKLKKAKKLFSHLNSKESYFYGMAIWLFGAKVYLSGARSERGELMIVATNKDPRAAIPVYLRRWEIENLFQGLKSRGFRFEETHVTHLERIEQLIALLAVGFCWAHKVGEWRAVKKPIIFNKYRDSRRPQYSYFRYGLDFLRDIVLHFNRKKREFKDCVKQLVLPEFSLLETQT